ncbi:MAG: hypothetical protein J6B34_02525 [Clostridia bacterium]|nr:hypothetical protein [Clostridia bacterium]
MKNILLEQYKSLISQKQFLKDACAKLPLGYLSKKSIKGKTQFYLQRREGDRVISSYVNAENVERVMNEIKLRKEHNAKLKDIDEQLKRLEKASRLIDKELLFQLLLYKSSYKIDSLSHSEKKKCTSFGKSMNDIEGVKISDRTKKEIELWENGDKNFISVFNDTLAHYGFGREDEK